MSTLAPDRRPALRLVMVTGANNNKVYEMADNGDGTFTARYGRIGARLQERAYPMARWATTYRQKVRKGYTDVTALSSEEGDDGFAIDDPSVAALIDALRAAADERLRAQYLVAPDAVGPRQVERAQACLAALTAQAARLDTPEAVAAFDAALLELYTVIPRAMGDVRDHLVGERLAADAVAAHLDGEQEALDRMAQRVRLREGGTRPTLLEALGVDLAPVRDAASLRQIRRAMGDEADHLHAAWTVHHPAQRARFEAHVAQARSSTTRLFWHGSRTENWLSILEQGLRLNPRARINGKMFGQGLYFASEFRKSLGYTSIHGAVWAGQGRGTGFMALYDVHVGRALTVRRHEPWCSQLDAARLAARRPFRRPDSVHARAGRMLRHDEHVVYHEAQVCPRYLVEVRTPDA